MVYYVSFATQAYFEHEYYDNGRQNCFIKVVGYMVNNKFVIDETEYLGIAIGFKNFRFD